jgi:hypothetical protein
MMGEIENNYKETPAGRPQHPENPALEIPGELGN